MNKRTIAAICIVIILIIIIWAAVAAVNRNHSNNSHTMVESGETSANNNADNEITAFINEQDTIMHTMIEAMGSLEYSGSADIDYLNGMIPHHESAVKMAESYLRHGANNDAMKTLAENIITTQNEEISLMNNMIKTIKAENTGNENAKKYAEEYVNMMQQGHSHNNNYDSIDKMFANGMIEHHQMAVDMSEIILKYGEDEEVKRLAENIIETQKKEVEEMNNFLND